MDKESGDSVVGNNESSNGDSDKQILAPAEGPREHLISTAIKFLQNPKVMSSPLYQKKSFLEKKGLTQEEINLAVERSGVKETVGSDMQVAVQTPPPGYQPGVIDDNRKALAPVYAPIPPQSTWGKMRDLTLTSVVVVGVSYGVYQLFQRYLRPLLLGKTQQEQRMERLEAQIMEIQKSVTDSLAELNKTMAGIQVALQNNQPQHPVQNNRDVADLKGDIASLKGLLLNKNQFPPAPAVSPVTLALPAWQRAQPSSTKTVVSPSPPLGEASSATSLTPEGDQASTVTEELNTLTTAQTSDNLTATETSDSLTATKTSDILTATETPDSLNTDSNDEANQHSSMAESDSV